VYAICAGKKKELKRILAKTDSGGYVEVDYHQSDYAVPQYKQSRQKNLQLVFNGYVYCRDSNRGPRVYW
jgi:hypothetical protein